MTQLVAFLLGTLFALGLGIGGMTQPGKIIGFLDVAGAWDPSLVLVLASSVVTYGILYRLSLRRRRPVLAESYTLPLATRVDGRLVAGAVVFGAGWGLSGFCPGPAIVGLVTGKMEVLVFVAAMAVGMLLHDRLAAAASRRASAQQQAASLLAGSADG